MALGGADVGWAQDPVGAMSVNPAGLGFLGSTELQVSLPAVLAAGRFTNSANSDARLDSRVGLVADGAYARLLPGTPVTLALGLIPEAPLSADWHYVDPPGGWGGASYGFQEHLSEILMLRAALGVGVRLGPGFAIGASFGPVYNANHLKAPYIFQSQPTLKGFKTLLDLETDGWGWGGTLGILARPSATLQWGLAYTSRVTVRSKGDASGNADAQFDTLNMAVRPDFHYDAEVETKFPQKLAAGLSWRFQPGWRLPVQVDWVEWSQAFDRLPVTLTHGDNADINGVVGSDSMQDVVPLRWDDRVVLHAGLEHEIADGWAARAGYSYGPSPVPDGTLTPLTAAIMEHAITLGAGYQAARYGLDFAYECDVPTSQRVGSSGLESGEYDDSRTQVSLHWLAVTASVRF
jgi:long-chain fatty acid transport protein